MKSAGFSLIEVLVATTLLVAAIVSLAHLTGLSIRSNARARVTTMAVLLAEAKLEELRAAEWSVDVAGAPATDAVVLAPSAPGTLTANTVGWVEYLDRDGRLVGRESVLPPGGTVYIRRWSVEPLSVSPDNALLLQVLVTPNRSRGAGDARVDAGRLPDEARLVTVKARKE